MCSCSLSIQNPDTAALMHAHLARRTLAFGPRVDLRRTHGAYVPDSAKAACTDAVMRSLRAKFEHALAGECAICFSIGTHPNVVSVRRVLPRRSRARQ